MSTPTTDLVGSMKISNAIDSFASRNEASIINSHIATISNAFQLLFLSDNDFTVQSKNVIYYARQYSIDVLVKSLIGENTRYPYPKIIRAQIDEFQDLCNSLVLESESEQSRLGEALDFVKNLIK